jgi:hypothetical protein
MDQNKKKKLKSCFENVKGKAMKSIRRKERKKKRPLEQNLIFFLVHTLLIKKGDTMRNKTGAIEH